MYYKTFPYIIYMPDYTSDICYHLPMFSLSEAYEAARQMHYPPVTPPQGNDKPEIPEGFSVLTTPTHIAVLNHETGKVIVADKPEVWFPPERMNVDFRGLFTEEIPE